jgi:hypothetical protein
MHFACGGRTGVLITRVSLPEKTSSNAGVNLLSRSRIRNLNSPARSPRSMSRLRVCGRLGGQELPPGRRRSSRRRAGPGRGQDPADRPLPHPVPQAEQLALDAPVSPAGILPGQLLSKGAHLVWDLRPSRRVRISPFLPGQAPVSGQQGAGVTIQCRPRRPGRSLARAAITARSAQSGLGRDARPRPHAAARGSPRPWLRHCAPGAPASRASGPMNRQMKRMNTSAERRTAGQTLREVLARHRSSATSRVCGPSCSSQARTGAGHAPGDMQAFPHDDRSGRTGPGDMDERGSNERPSQPPHGNSARASVHPPPAQADHHS